MFVKLLKDWRGKPAGETIDVPDDFAPLLLDQELAAPLPANDLLQGVIARSLEQATGKWTQNMDQVIDRTLQKFQDAQGRARKHSVPAILSRGTQNQPPMDA